MRFTIMQTMLTPLEEQIHMQIPHKVQKGTISGKCSIEKNAIIIRSWTSFHERYEHVNCEGPSNSYLPYQTRGSDSREEKG